MITIMSNDVVHAGTASIIHMSAAQTKIAIIRCWMGVSPGIPNIVVGNRAMVNAMIAITETLMYLLYLRRKRRHRPIGVYCCIVVI
jgi:hypothetical protein